MKDYKQAGKNRYFINKEKDGEKLISLILQEHQTIDYQTVALQTIGTVRRNFKTFFCVNMKLFN